MAQTHPDIHTKFVDKRPTATLLQEITKEYLDLSSVSSQIEQTLEWDCVKASLEYRKYLEATRDKVEQQLMKIDMLDEKKIADLDN